MNDVTIDDLQAGLARFAADRGFDDYHSPKNLTMALASEVGHVVEQLKWLSEDQSRAMSAERRAVVEQELADVFNYTIRLAAVLGIDPLSAGWRRLQSNLVKHPVGEAPGQPAAR